MPPQQIPSSRFTLVLAALCLVACAKDEPSAEGGTPAATEAGAATDPEGGGSPAGEASSAQPSSVRSASQSEEGLLEALAAAIAARDMEAVAAVSAPELAADLKRLRAEDEGRFWRRGDRLVENVKSGLAVSHRQDDTAARWRVLIAFGNGSEETVTFTRVDGRLKIDAL